MLLWSPGVREPARQRSHSNTWLTGLPSSENPEYTSRSSSSQTRSIVTPRTSAGTSRSSRNRTSSDLLLEPDGARQLLDTTVKEIQPRRMVIDSLNHREMYLPRGGDMRKEAYRILNYVKTKGISPLAIWETQQTAGQAFNVTEVGMSFLVDCILLLKFVEIESAMRKALVIMKMRGSDHEKELKEYAITPQGFKIQGSFSDYEGVMSGSPHKVASERFVDMFQKASEKHKGGLSHQSQP